MRGPGLDAQLRGELVAAQRRARRVAVPGQGLGQHLARQLHVGLDHLGARERAAAPGGEPVGGAEQGDVGGDGLGRAQVLVDGAARERTLVDQEAEAQVVQRQPLQVGAEGVAGPKPAADPGDDLGPRAVVADEGDVAGLLAPRLRACRGRGRARRSAAPRARVSSSASGSARKASTCSARSGAKPARSDSIASHSSSTASVWPWTSRWWLGFWTTPRVASSSGSTTAVSSSSSSSSSARSGAGPPSIPRSSANWRSPAASAASPACERARRSVPSSISSE